MQELLTQEVLEEITAAAESSGCELVHAELHGNRLQVILDHEDGVTISHCEQVSKKLSAVLDMLDFGDTEYVLEVSSPGLDRQLYGPVDYARFSGSLTRVTWSDPEHGKRTDVGRLGPFEVGQAEMVLAVGESETLEVPVSSVLEARLEIEA